MIARSTRTSIYCNSESLISWNENEDCMLASSSSTMLLMELMSRCVGSIYSRNWRMFLYEGRSTGLGLSRLTMNLQRYVERPFL